MALSPSDDTYSCDAFLGGRLHLYQPRQGYRAGIDPVLLAASVPARVGETVLELGCGAGAALLCLGTRVSGLRLFGVELQAEYAELCRKNTTQNGLEADIYTADLSALPPEIRQKSFDHVIANPPYFQRNTGTTARNDGREIALGEITPLSHWVQTAARRAAPGGTVTFIQRAERLPDLLNAACDCLGSLELLPIVPRQSRPARLILVRGRKGGRAAFRCHDSLILHKGAQHISDGDDYTSEVSAILRDGAPLLIE